MNRTRDFHLAIPESTARAVDRTARAKGMKRAQLLRLALEQYLEGIAREEREAGMRKLVREMAPYSGEFVRETEAEVARQILGSTEW